MNKIILILALALSLPLMSCSSITGSEDNKSSELVSDNKASDSEMVPEYLTYETFLEKVWNFEKNPQEWVYEGELPCVIDFYADWCKPCKMVAPIMDEMAKTYDGKVKIYKIDVDKEKKLAGVFGIRSIPSVLFAPKVGQPMMQAGALPKDQYIQIIESQLLKNTPESKQ